MFHWIEARVYCHATEEEDRVLRALRTVMPEIEPTREALAGHFGNALLVLTSRAEDARSQRSAWARIVAALGKDEILSALEVRLDPEGVYHLRLDKQEAYLGGIQLATTTDAIAFRAKVAAFPKKPAIVVEVLRRAAEEA